MFQQLIILRPNYGQAPLVLGNLNKNEPGWERNLVSVEKIPALNGKVVL